MSCKWNTQFVVNSRWFCTCNSHNLFGFIFLAAYLCSSLQHLVFIISWWTSHGRVTINYIVCRNTFQLQKPFGNGAMQRMHFLFFTDSFLQHLCSKSHTWSRKHVLFPLGLYLSWSLWIMEVFCSWLGRCRTSLHDSDLSSAVSPQRLQGSPCVKLGGAVGFPLLCVRGRPSLSLKEWKIEKIKLVDASLPRVWAVI